MIAGQGIRVASMADGRFSLSMMFAPDNGALAILSMREMLTLIRQEVACIEQALLTDEKLDGMLLGAGGEA